MCPLSCQPDLAVAQHKMPEYPPTLSVELDTKSGGFIVIVMQVFPYNPAGYSLFMPWNTELYTPGLPGNNMSVFSRYITSALGKIVNYPGLHPAAALPRSGDSHHIAIVVTIGDKPL